MRRETLVEVPDKEKPVVVDNANIGVASILKYEPERVEISAALGGDGYLILTDTYYPGWTAVVDGKEERIYPANYAFRGVFLKEGVHTVVFKYKPKSFKTGWIISLLTLALTVAVAVKICVKPKHGKTI